MIYKSVETYIFNINKEKDALLKFKQDLNDSSIPFTEEGGNFMYTIKITTNGIFDMNKTDIA